MEFLLCQDDTPQLSSDTKNYLSGILGKNGGNAATSSYHGNDNDDHDDDNLDYTSEQSLLLHPSPTDSCNTGAYVARPRPRPGYHNIKK